MGVLAPQWLHDSPQLGEAILGAEYSGKSLDSQGSATNHNWKSSECSPRPHSWWEGVAAPPQEPHPTLGLQSCPQ